MQKRVVLTRKNKKKEGHLLKSLPDSVEKNLTNILYFSGVLYTQTTRNSFLPLQQRFNFLSWAFLSRSVCHALRK